MNETETTIESGWTTENLQKLFAAMKRNIPKRYRMGSYRKALKTMNWSEVAFRPFSPEECREKWGDILLKMRTVRSLTELIDEADDVLSDPARNIKIHPAFPKRPGPPNAMFYEANVTRLKEQHPELSQRQAVRILAKKYSTLPNEEKAHYVKKHQLAVKEYKTRITEFRKQYLKPLDDKSKQKKKKKKKEEDEEEEDEEEEEEEVSVNTPDGQDTEGLPLKPPSNGYNLFCKEQMKSVNGASRKDFGTVSSKRWRDLTEKQRNKYIIRCRELKKQYAIKLNQYLQGFDEEEHEQILEDNGIKRPKEWRRTNRKVKARMRLPGEPKMPARSSNSIFVKNQMELLREEVPVSRERFSRVNRMWQDLPIKEKESYKAKVNANLRRYSMELQKWFKTLTPAEQEDYQRHNPSKLQFLDVKVTKVHDRKEQCPSRPSDSEDEDLEDSSSSEEEEDSVNCDEDEEEEVNGDDIFGIWGW